MASLSIDDKKRIRTTLSLFTENITENMLQFYVSFLSNNPHYMGMFYSLRGVSPDPDKLLENEWLKGQGPRFASAIVSLVEKMEDGPALRGDIQRLMVAPRHTKHNLTVVDYMVAFNTFISTMKLVLHENMTTADVQAWQHFVDKLKVLMEVELKKVNDSK